MNKYLLWFRLAVGNCLCLGVSTVTMITSFIVPIAWIFTFILVCRAFDPSGYWATFGVLIAYTVVCVCVWLAWCGLGAALCCAANVPGSCGDGQSENSPLSAKDVNTKNAEIRSGWLASLTDPDGVPANRAYADYLAKQDKLAVAHENRPPMACVELVGNIYLLTAIILFPLMFLALMPLILIRTRTYSAAFGLGCALVGVYIGGVIALPIVLCVVYGIAWAVVWTALRVVRVVLGIFHAVTCGLWNHLSETYQTASAVSDGFAPTTI